MARYSGGGGGMSRYGGRGGRGGGRGGGGGKVFPENVAYGRVTLISVSLLSGYTSSNAAPLGGNRRW